MFQLPIFAPIQVTALIFAGNKDVKLRRIIFFKCQHISTRAYENHRFITGPGERQEMRCDANTKKNVGLRHVFIHVWNK